MRVLDLTQPMREGMPVYPGDPLFRARPAADHGTDGFRVTELALGTHTGTHLDFPFHFFEDGERAEAFGPEMFFLKAAVLDLTAELERFRSGRLPPVILPELLELFPAVFSEAEAVILKTGWSRRWNEAGFFTAFPSFLPETADWLAEQPIRLLGLETPSLSALAYFAPQDGSLPSSSRRGSGADEILFLHADAEAHRLLLGRVPPVFLLENLLLPDELPAVRSEDAGSWKESLFTLAVFPLRLCGADASPVRAAALLDS